MKAITIVIEDYDDDNGDDVDHDHDPSPNKHDAEKLHCIFFLIKSPRMSRYAGSSLQRGCYDNTTVQHLFIVLTFLVTTRRSRFLRQSRCSISTGSPSQLGR